MDSEDDNENSTEWVDELAVSLSSHAEFSVIRNIAKNRTFPERYRAQAWLVLLGVAHKADPFTAFDQLYDLPEQGQIRNQCQRIVQKLGNEDKTDKLSITSDLESILTFYSKQRRASEQEFNLDSLNEETSPTAPTFDGENGASDVLQLLCALHLPKHHLYNVFYALSTKYIPRGCVPNGRPFDLFRLLLLYHDPQLCSFLDTKKLTPDLYAKAWFNSLFASTCSLDVALTIWDVYLQQADPFLLFFMALVILVNAKEQILEMIEKPKEVIASTIAQFPAQLEAEDIADFCQLALYYSRRTPQSFRRDYHGPLYGSHFTMSDFDSVSVHSLLCLPVSIQELLKANADTSVDYSENDDSVRYFLVDCRPPKQYNDGHLPGAFSLDASLIVNNPTQFQLLAKTLEEIKTRMQIHSHWCFMGSGREEEDKYLHMVASYFLQRNVPYVSLARNGYRALHEVLKETLATRLKSHNVKGCLACNEAYGQSNDEQKSSAREQASDHASSPINTKPRSIFNKVRDVMTNKSTAVKDYVLKTASDISGQREEDSVHHVDSHDRGKKAYRNLANVFSISEDASEDDGSAEEEDDADDFTNGTGGREKIKLKDFFKKQNVLSHFECGEISDTNRIHPSVLALTQTYLFVLRELPEQAGYAVVKCRRNLSSIQHITSKRQHPEILTFKYGFQLTPDRQKITGRERFWVPKAGDCAKAVKIAIVSLLNSESGFSSPTDAAQSISASKLTDTGEI